MTAGCSSTPAPRRSTTGTCRTAPTCAPPPRCAWPGATPSPWPASASTTSPTSTSTPASPPRCRSGRSSSASCPTRRPTAPGWGSIGATRPLTVTGGMTFAGGPLNDYTSHGIATMAGVLRAEPGAVGLCTANGGYTTEHAVVVLSTEPPAAGRVPPRRAAGRGRRPAAGRARRRLDRPGRDRERHRGVRARGAHPRARRDPHARTARGRGPRSTDEAFLAAAQTEELVGRSGQRLADGTVELT